MAKSTVDKAELSKLWVSVTNTGWEDEVGHSGFVAVRAPSSEDLWGPYLLRWCPELTIQ